MEKILRSRHVCRICQEQDRQAAINNNGPRYELKTIKQTKGKNGASGARFGFWFQMEKDLTSHDLVEAAKVDGVGK